MLARSTVSHEESPDSLRRRRRPAVSCTNCRKRKTRCNRELPCNHCVRSRSKAACIYDVHPPLATRPQAEQTQSTNPEPSRHAIDGIAFSSAASIASLPSHSSSRLSTAMVVDETTPGSIEQRSVATSPAHEMQAMQRKIRQLESQLSTMASIPHLRPHHDRAYPPEIEEQTTRVGGTLYFDHDAGITGRTRGVIRSVGHKRRLFSQGHWMILAPWVSDLLQLLESQISDDTSKAYAGLQRCKHWGKVIKEAMRPPWPCPPTRDLPDRKIADELVECYLQTMETLYRVVHVPSFRRDYEAMWTTPQPDMAFVVQVKLIMAIGAATHDDRYSMRRLAIRWVYEAQTWDSNPIFKCRVRLDLMGLQNHILLLIARELAGVDDDATWISAGALLREGMYIGLHRDPSRLPKNTKLASEMRLRLWNTIVEISLQSCLTSGAPPHLSLDDFDAGPPGNYDDEQLLDDDSVPRRDAEITSSSVARALRKTFPQRLAILRLLNDIGCRGTYEDTLCIDGEFRDAYKTLSRTLQACSPSPGAAPFAIRATEYIMRHYLACLHVPFFGISFHETAYAYSRKVAVESSLRAWSTAHPDTKRDDGPDVLARLVVCSSGFFRSAAFQAALVAALELKTQVQEDAGSLGPATPRADLLCVLEDAKTFTLRALEAGRTNLKGHLLLSILAAQIDGLGRRLDRDAIAELIGRAAEEVEERVLPILEGMAAHLQAEVGGMQMAHEPIDLAVNFIGDWDFLMSDPMFGTHDAPVHWDHL